MSDTTLYSSLYQQISQYAELIDETLIAFVSKRRDVKLEKRLGDMLIELANPNEGHLAPRMISQMILDEDAIGSNELEAAGKSLQDGNIDEITKGVIEQVARLLEQERTKAMARMRGETR
jgi:hypothetical protein